MWIHLKLSRNLNKFIKVFINHYYNSYLLNLGPVWSVVFINDGIQFVSGSEDGKLNLVDVHSLNSIKQF